MNNPLRIAVEKLVKTSISFHQLNKKVQVTLGLSLVQYHCLSRIRLQPGISSQSLARAIGLHPSSLTPTIKRLRSKGWIFVGEDPKDSRRTMLSLTPEGNGALKRFEEGATTLVSSV